MKQLICIICVCVLLFAFCGCTKEEQKPEESIPMTTHTTVKLLDLDIENAITHIELESALGFTVTEPIVTNSGSSLFTNSEDGKVSVTVSMTKQPSEQFDKSVAAIPNVKEVPNLGDKAFGVWDSSMGMESLFAYSNGYGLSCTITSKTVGEEDSYLDARAILATIIGKF